MPRFQAPTVVDTMFGYYAPHWDVEVSIKNIVDVEYFTTAQSAGGYVGQPRTYYGPTRLALLSGDISSLPQADENRASRQLQP